MSRVWSLRPVETGENSGPNGGDRERSVVGHSSIGNQKRCHRRENEKRGGRVKISGFTTEQMTELTVRVCEDSGWSFEISSQGRFDALHSLLVALTVPFSSPEEAEFGFTIFLRSLSD